MTLNKRHVLFGAYCVCAILGNYRVVRALFDLARSNDSASHVVVAPFVTLALVYQSRTVIFSSVRCAWFAGLGIIVAGLALVSLAVSLSQLPSPAGSSLTAAVAALVILYVGGFVMFYGRDAFGAALFPLLFLGFMIPIPQVVLDRAIYFLQAGSAEMVAGLFTLTGTPHLREGFTFNLPTLAIEIAEECSGIRSSIALLFTSLLAGHMFLNDAWKKAVVVAAIVPIAIVKNGIRIVSLSLLAIHVDPDFLVGRLHHDGGVVFFLVGLVILAFVLTFLRNLKIGSPSRDV
jgi:exosortase